jgi:hypothetical protein
MGNTQSIIKINFEDMQTATKNPETYLIINTLSAREQQCLIKGTVGLEQEEAIINKYIKDNRGIKIVIYGKHSHDESVQKKYQQLLSLGFYNVYAYIGGIFEWLLLQDIYGHELFPTSKKELDLLKFKPAPTLNISLLEN